MTRRRCCCGGITCDDPPPICPGGATGVLCRNLTMSYPNPLVGAGAFRIFLVSPYRYKSRCIDPTSESSSGPLQVYLDMSTNPPVLTVELWSGGCATFVGSCTSADGGLTLGTVECGPYVFEWTLTGASCPLLNANGYSSFIITE